MRKHTKEFKSSISTFGRELDSKITVVGTGLILGKEDLFSITPVTNSTLLKSVMKEVDFESKKQIGIGQEVNIKSGVKVNGEYEYIDYGNYSVYKSEYKAETDTYSHICYDKMLKTMIDYTPLDITYPINLREYINAIATKCGLEFADKNSTFANYNTSINEDHFSNGNYTFRDVLDYIAQLVGGWLCINDNDELEIRYPELARNYDKVSGENVSFTSNVEDEISTIIVDGKSTQATSTDPVSPSPDYPSEIECVKDTIQVKDVGKNLLNIPDGTYTSNGLTAVISNGIININGTSTATSFLSIPINLELESNFSISLNNTVMGDSLSEVRLQKSGSNYQSVLTNVANNKKENISAYGTYTSLLIRISSGVTITNGIIKPQVELGNTTDYEPYQENILNIDLQGNELCSLPNNVKDELVIENGRAKIIKRIGKVVLNGSENWNLTSRTDRYSFWKLNSSISNMLNYKHYKLCNYFKYENESFSTASVPSLSENSSDANPMIVFNTDGSQGTTVAEWKNWLSTHNIQLYYQLATPTEIDLGEVETLSTFKGVNNVSLDANMQTNMSLTYTFEYEELDKHFLKDVNVSFYKKYGAVNSVVFSRGNGSDNIYRKDNMSISRNGLTEIKITGNPFLEGNDRENFIQQLFDKINGLEFYIMDVSSTGIMYLELGDFYYFNMVEEKPSLKSGLVKSGMRQAQGSSGGKFLCLLMNDEIKITQGLEESIYSDEPEITETDYKTASITDTSIKNAIIQTNKNSAEILLKVNSDEVVSAINLSPEKIKISSSKLDIDAIATFTNSKLAEAGSTVINGANITTGYLSADRISGGIISASTIKLKGTELTPTSSSIGGLNVGSGIISNDRMGLDTVNGIVKVFNSNGGSMILSNAARLSATAGIGLTSNSNGNVSAPSVNLDLKACSGAKAYLGSMINADGTGERSGITCSNGILEFRSTGYCTYNGTTVFGSSSKATKENIEDLSQEQKEEVYELIKNIPTKQYDYKKEYGKPFNYGFVIEDIENTKLKELLHITQAENNKDIKMYSTEDLVRLQLIVIQELMKKVENLEKKESENNAKD